MFLSNTRRSRLFLLCSLLVATACGSKPVDPSANGELAGGEQTFAGKEPNVYQAQVFYSSGGTSDKYFVARNGAARRVDTYKGDKAVVTELIKDNNRYVIDHVRKIYYIDPPSEKGPKVVNPAALAFFQNSGRHEFDEIGRSNGQIIYRVRKQAGEPDGDVVLTIDEKTGLMVRQEVKSSDPQRSLAFELKDLMLEAPDDLFMLPAGYKQVTKEEFNPGASKEAEAGQPLDGHIEVGPKKSHE